MDNRFHLTHLSRLLFVRINLLRSTGHYYRTFEHGFIHLGLIRTPRDIQQCPSSISFVSRWYRNLILIQIALFLNQLFPCFNQFGRLSQLYWTFFCIMSWDIFFAKKNIISIFCRNSREKKSKCSFIGAKQYIEEYLGWLGVILLSCKCKPVCQVWNTVNLRSSVLKGRLMLKSSQWINCEFKTDSRECKSFCCY